MECCLGGEETHRVKVAQGDSTEQLGPEGSEQEEQVEDGYSRQAVVVQRRECVCGTVRKQILLKQRMGD